MTGKEYQKLAMRTSPVSEDDKEARLYHGVFGLTSEAGEVAGILQKIYQGHVCDINHLKKEVGDALWMCAEIASALGTDLDEIMEINIEKLKKRYPDGFSVERSLNRAEGDV